MLEARYVAPYHLRRNQCPPVYQGGRHPSSTTGFGSQVVIDVLGNDSVAGDVLDTATIEVTRAPRHGVVDLTATPGQVTYQPDTGFRGEDHFRYVVRSQAGVVSNAAEVTVSVAEDGAPVVLDDYVQRLDGATLAINVLGNDRGLSAALDPSTLAVANGPGQGTVVFDGADDVFRYTPDDAFSGTDTFTYTVRDLDNTVSQSATVTISDVAVNPAPIANDHYVFVTEDSPATCHLPNLASRAHRAPRFIGCCTSRLLHLNAH